MNKKAVGNLIIVIFVILIIGAGVLVVGGILPGSSPDNPRMDVECFVEIKNPLLFNSKFGDIECSTKPSSLFTIYSILPDFLEDKGTIKMIAQSKSTSKRYEVTEGKSKTYSLTLKKLDVKSFTANFILYNDKGEILEKKDIFVT